MQGDDTFDHVERILGSTLHGQALAQTQTRATLLKRGAVGVAGAAASGALVGQAEAQDAKTAPPPALREVPFPQSGRPGPGDGRPFHLMDNPRYLPRARLVAGVTVEADDDRALALLRSSTSPHDRSIVLADCAPAEPPAEPSSEPPGSATIVLDRPDSVRVRIFAV